MSGAGWLVRAFGTCCAALLALGLLLFYLNDFTTLMTLNRPEGGYGLRFVDALVAATFPRAGSSSTYLLVVNLALAATFTPVGVLIASRRPSNSLGWLFCVTGLLAGLLVVADQYTIYALLTQPGSLPAGAAAAWLASWIWLPVMTFTFTLLPLLFPDGRPLTRRWWAVVWLAVMGMTMIIFYLAFLAGPIGEGPPLVENPLGIPAASGVLELCLGVGAVIGWSCIFASAASLILRLRRSRSLERQQIKWFAYAATMAALTLVAGTLVRGAGSSDVLGTILQFVALPLLPVAIAIAILKHHLYDIDVIINRTLVYGALTASLALVYFGSVAGLQYVFRGLTGQDSQLAIVASTLAIAALFSPLRRLIQTFIDQRFYRRKYDAANTLQAFSMVLRDETDLDSLSDDLISVTRDTMQPEHVSLWLREPEGRG